MSLKPSRRLALAGLLSLGAFTLPAHAQTDIQWWHSMGGALGEWVNDLAKDFNASQKDYKIVPTFKGSYDESMTAAIAAFRAGNAPHVLQVFEVGTATMMAAKGAIKPVHEVMKEAGEKFDPNAYLPAITGYYSTAKGDMLSMPFNSSTPVLYWNKELFKEAGLDPERGKTDEALKHFIQRFDISVLSKAGEAGVGHADLRPFTYEPGTRDVSRLCSRTTSSRKAPRITDCQ